MDLKKICIEKARISSYWIGSFFLFGIVGHSISLTLPWMLRMTPWLLFLLGGVMLLPEYLQRNDRFWLWLPLAYGITLALEIIGVKTGWIFGDYHYGHVLGLSLGGVPLIIGLNWVLVVLGIDNLLNSISLPDGLKILLAALACTFFDFLMEPVAIQYHYWNWQGGRVPIQNYLAWFSIALLCLFLIRLLKVKKDNPLLGYYVIIQCLFFFTLHLLIKI